MVSAIEPPPGWRAERVTEKLDAGAGFLLSRACLDVNLLRQYAAALVALRFTHRATFVVSVPLLTSLNDLRWLNAQFPDTVIPQTVAKGLHAAGDTREQGISDCVAMIAALRDTPGVSGVNLIYRGDVEDVAEVLRRAG